MKITRFGYEKIGPNNFQEMTLVQFLFDASPDFKSLGPYLRSWIWGLFRTDPVRAKFDLQYVRQVRMTKNSATVVLPPLFPTPRKLKIWMLYIGSGKDPDRARMSTTLATAHMVILYCQL